MRLPQINETFEERYELTHVLGEGAFARVFKAKDLRTDRFVALKVLKPQGDGYRDLTSARFLREAQVLAGLQSPHTVTLFDFGETPGGLLYMATEFIDGRDLHLALVQEQRMDGLVVAHVLDQLLQSLLEAHGHNILHRDIKPANILLREYGGDRYFATLVDFGLAKSVTDASNNLTQEGKTAGTPRYMPPEQVFGEELGPASDLYSLGLVAYEMWVGESAIQGTTNNELLMQQIHGKPIVLPPHLEPAPLRAIIEKMTRKEIAERFSSAAEVLHELRAMRRALRASGSQPNLNQQARAAMLTPSSPSMLPPQRAAMSPAPAEPTFDERAPRSTRFALVGFLVGVVATVAIVMVLWPSDEPDIPQLPPALNQVSSLTQPRVERPSPEPDPAAEPASTAAEAPKCGKQLASGLQKHPVENVGMMEMWGSANDLVSSEAVTYLPEGLDVADVRAIIAVFAPNSQIPLDGFIHYTDFDKIADRESLLIVALPPKTGYKARSWGDHSTEMAWRALLHIRHDHCLDDVPIGVLGEKLGGQAIDYLLCSPTGIGAAVVTSHRYKESHSFPALKRGIRPCEPHIRPPYMIIEHTENKHHPMRGGAGCESDDNFSSIEYDQSRWRSWYNCTGQSGAPISYDDGACQKWACDSPYIACLAEGGELWKPLPQPPGCESRASKFPHSEVAWEFFKTNLLAQE